MDLNFLTGNAAPVGSGMSWLTGSNQNQSFDTPAMNYQPGSTIGMNLSGNTANPATSFFGSGSASQLGLNIPTFQLGLGALGSLANIYSGFQANSLAKDQLAFTKSITNTNLNNSIKSYNTQLEDRARSRATAENRDQSSADAYIAANKLSR